MKQRRSYLDDANALKGSVPCALRQGHRLVQERASQNSPVEFDQQKEYCESHKVLVEGLQLK